jgi:predicted ABC-type transport system involved in lysophospholipase L1 biosynthesis ATPase subunit
MTTPALELRGVTQRFPGVVALDDVHLTVRPREVVGLIGENGAGKSTLLKILSGVYQPDEGELLVRGQARRFTGPRDAARAGVGIVHQEQSLVASRGADQVEPRVEHRGRRGGPRSVRPDRRCLRQQGGEGPQLGVDPVQLVALQLIGRDGADDAEPDQQQRRGEQEEPQPQGQQPSHRLGSRIT